MTRATVLLLSLSFTATGQTIDTIAGAGPPGGPMGPDGAAAVNVQIGAPSGVAVDSAGNVYVVSPAFHRVLKIDSKGIVTTTADGVSADRVAVDQNGNLFITDSVGCRVRQVSGGVVTTIAGNGPFGPLGDGGPALAATVCPSAIAVDRAGNVYLAEATRIRKVSSGFITTVATRDSVPALPPAVAVDSSGNVYFTSGQRVMELSGGTVATVAGAGIQDPSGLAVDESGNLYIAESEPQTVLKVNGGAQTTVAGLDGNTIPVDVAVDAAGRLYIADQTGRVVVLADSVSTTIAGGGRNYSGDGGPATAALLNHPQGVAVDSSGAYYIADTGNNRVRKVSGGVITTVAGSGTAGFSGDGGSATEAQLNSPFRVALDASGNLYIADTGNQRIRKVSGGVITTVAGNGTAGFSGDGGQAVNAALRNPSGVAVDGAGNLYIADSSNNRVRQVTGGIITTVADSLLRPTDVAVDSSGTLYVADSGHNLVAKVSSGTVTTIASAPGVEGLAVAGGFRLDYSVPSYVVNTPVVGLGATIIAAGTPDRCQFLGGAPAVAKPSARDVTCGGPLIPGDGFAGDGGPAAGSKLERPAGLAVDSHGALYITDSGNNRIRRVCDIPVTIDTTPAGRSVTLDGVSYTAPQTVSFCFGESHSIGVPAQASGDSFVSWSDGGSATHSIVAQSAATYVAVFGNLHYYLELPEPPLGSAGGSISVGASAPGAQASSLRWANYYPSGATVQLNAVPRTGYVFHDWGGDLNGATANPLNVTMSRNYTGWANFWPDPNAGPSIGQLQLPFAGSGATAKLTFGFAHSSGGQSLDVVNVLVNNALDGRQACYLGYVVSSRTLVLVDDAGDSGGPFAGSVTLGDSATIRNSQCAVSLVSATTNGPDLSLTLNITFQASFGGDKLFYLAARDAARRNTGWEVFGAWQASLTSAGPIAASGVTPASGTNILGETQTFTATFTDTQGAAGIGIVNLLVNNSLDGRQACYLAYDQAGNSLYLVDDAGNAGGPYAGGIVLDGRVASVRNNQCEASGSVARSGNTLALVVNLRFNAAQFSGKRVFYVAARNGSSNTGWQAAGVWAVQ